MKSARLQLLRASSGHERENVGSTESRTRLSWGWQLEWKRYWRNMLKWTPEKQGNPLMGKLTNRLYYIYILSPRAYICIHSNLHVILSYNYIHLFSTLLPTSFSSLPSLSPNQELVVNNALREQAGSGTGRGLGTYVHIPLISKFCLVNSGVPSWRRDVELNRTDLYTVLSGVSGPPGALAIPDPKNQGLGPAAGVGDQGPTFVLVHRVSLDQQHVDGHSRIPSMSWAESQNGWSLSISSGMPGMITTISCWSLGAQPQRVT